MLTKKRNLSRLMLVFILLLTISSVIFINVEAACGQGSGCTSDHKGSSKRCPLCGHLHDWGALDGMGKTLWTYAVGAYGDVVEPSNPAGDGTGGGSANVWSLTETLRFDTGTVFADVMNAAEVVYGLTASLGCIVIFVYFLLEIADVSMNDGFTYETLARHAIKTLAAMMIIRNGFDIVCWGLGVCTEVFDLVSNGVSSNGQGAFSLAGCPYWICKDANFIDYIGGIVSYIVPYLAILVATLIIRVICWTRMLDIIIRVMLAPIGMADLLKGGMNSSGVRYFKKLLASSLQGTCILAVLAAYKAIAATIYSMSSGLFPSVVVALALLTAVKKTGDIAKDVMGV